MLIFLIQKKTTSSNFSPKEKIIETQKLINELNYSNAVSNSYYLLNRNKFKEASRELKTAIKIKPNAQEIHNIKNLIASKKDNYLLLSLSRNATDFEKKERWSDALKVYKKAILRN